MDIAELKGTKKPRKRSAWSQDAEDSRERGHKTGTSAYYGPPRFTTKQLAANRRKAAKALADWNAGTRQNSPSSTDDQGSRSHSLDGTGGDPRIRPPNPACTTAETPINQSRSTAGPSGPSLGTPPLVHSTASTEEDDSTPISPGVPFRRFHGFDRVHIADSEEDCIQDGEAVERNRNYGPDSQEIPTYGFGAHVPGLGTPQMSIELSDFELPDDDDPMDTLKQRLEDEALHSPGGGGFFHQSGRIGFGMLDPNTQCPPHSPDEGATGSPGMDSQIFGDSQFGVESTPATTVGGQGGIASCRNSTQNGKASSLPGSMTANTTQGEGISLDRVPPVTRATPPSRGATRTAVATSSNGTIPTANAKMSANTFRGPVTPTDRVPPLLRSTPPGRGASNSTVATSSDGARHTTNAKTSASTPEARVSSRESVAAVNTSTPGTGGATKKTIERRAGGPVATTNGQVSTQGTRTAIPGPSTRLIGSRLTTSRILETPSSMLGVGRPPIHRATTMPTRLSPCSTPPAKTTSTTPSSYRPSTSTLHRTPTSNYSTQASTLPTHFFPPRTTTCTPPRTEAIRNLQASTPLAPLNPSRVGVTPHTHRSELSHEAIRTTSTGRNEIPTAPAITTTAARRRPTTTSPPRSPVSSRVPPTPPSSPVSPRVSPSQPTTRVTAPQAGTSNFSRGTTTEAEQNNGTGNRPRRSQRNSGAGVPNEGSEIGSLEENLTGAENTPTSEAGPNRPFDKKRPRKDMNTKELADLRERDKMRKRQNRAQQRLLSMASQGANGGSGSVLMTWRPVIKLYDGMPVGESQQQLVRALSRLLPNLIPCYRHARSLTDVELARIHNELKSRYENGCDLLPTWTRRACGSLLLSRRMRTRTKVRAHLLTLTRRPHGGIEPPAGVLQCELKYFIQELASEEFQRRSERMTALSRAMVAARGCGNAMGAGGVDRARAFYTLREGKPPTIADVRAWKEKCVKLYKEGPSRTALELRLQDPGPLESEDNNTIGDEDESRSASTSTSEDDSEGDSSGDGGDKQTLGDGTPDPDWYHPFLGPAAFFRRYVFLYEKEPTQEELEAWLSSGRPPLPHGN